VVFIYGVLREGFANRDTVDFNPALNGAITLDVFLKREHEMVY
jgi:hypothetical protein